MKRLLFLLLLLPTLAQAQTMMLPVSYTWTPPTTGSAVHHYVVETRPISETTWSQVATTPTNSVTLSLPVGIPWVVRVAGVDAQDRQGPYSPVSDPYTPDPGAPGVPGVPVRTP